MHIGILGDGGWGTALAIHLNRKGFKICLWSPFRDYALVLDKERVNSRYLPGVKIPSQIQITANLKEAIVNKELIILAIPSQYLRRVLRKVKKIEKVNSKIYLSVTKGIEVNTLKRMSEVIYEELGKIDLAVLSGPTIAYEVAKNIPTTAVIASSDKKLRKNLQAVFMSQSFRVYTNKDMVGVELGGSLKNIIAIACGISDGLGFGTNTKAALLTRGLVEISRLGVKMGASPQTFRGISGLGDLVTTCISPYSRNRFVGEQIGKGKSLKQILKTMKMVAEGILTTKSTYQLSKKYNVEMPITKEVYLVLYKNKPPLKAVCDLMSRKEKEEDDF